MAKRIARKATPLSMPQRLAKSIAGNRIKYATAILGLIAAFGTAVAQRANLLLVWDNVFWATPHYARENEVTKLLTGTVHVQGIYLNTILLRDDRQALKDAQQELKDHPDSRSAAILIDEIQKKIAERERTLDQASMHGAE